MDIFRDVIYCSHKQLFHKFRLDFNKLRKAMHNCQSMFCRIISFILICFTKISLISYWYFFHKLWSCYFAHTYTLLTHANTHTHKLFLPKNIFTEVGKYLNHILENNLPRILLHFLFIETKCILVQFASPHFHSFTLNFKLSFKSLPIIFFRPFLSL